MRLGLAVKDKVTNDELTLGLICASISANGAAVTLDFGIGGVGDEVIRFSKVVALASSPGNMQEIVDQEKATIKGQLRQLASS